MAARGLKPSIEGIATAYRDFLDVLIVDDSDAPAAQALTSERLQLHCTKILMRSDEDKARIARTAVTLGTSAVAHVAEVK
jgi:LPPG:FO 2-phospho-L-lactate transferase